MIHYHDEDIYGVAFEALGMAEGRLYFGIMEDDDDDLDDGKELKVEQEYY